MVQLNKVLRVLAALSFAMAMIVVFDSCRDDDDPEPDPNPTTTTTTDDTATTDTDSGMTEDTVDGPDGGPGGEDGGTDGTLSCFDGGTVGNIGEPGINYSDVAGSDIPIQFGNTWSYSVTAGGSGSWSTSSDDEMFIDGVQFVRYWDSWFHMDFKELKEAIDIGGGEYSVVTVFKQDLNDGDIIDISDSSNGVSGTGEQVTVDIVCTAAPNGELCSRYDVYIEVGGSVYRDQKWWIVDGVGIVQMQEGDYEVQLESFSLTDDVPFVDADVTPSDAGIIPFGNSNSWTYTSSIGDNFTIVHDAANELVLFNNQFFKCFDDRWIFSRQGEYIEAIDADGECALRTLLNFNLDQGDSVESDMVMLANGDDVQIKSKLVLPEALQLTVNGNDFEEVSLFEVEYFVNGTLSNTEQWRVKEGIGVLRLNSENPEFEYELLDWEIN